MTFEEWKKKEKRAHELVKEGKITPEEEAAFQKVMKMLVGRCLTCRWNDGSSHGECWSCDD